MSANPRTLSEAIEEIEQEETELDPVEELDFRSQTINWGILSDMGMDYE